MYALASAAVTDRNASAIPLSNRGTLRSARFRNIAFTFEIAFSIGLKSGEYGGSRSTTQPADPIKASTRRSLCAARLSSTTTCPLRKAGHNSSRTKATKRAAARAAVEAGRGDDTFDRQGRDRADRLVVPVRHFRDDTLAGRRPAVRPLHLRVRPELVEKHQVGNPLARELLEPCGPLGYDVGAVLLGGVRRLFFRGRSSRLSVRLTVPGETGLPIASATSARVASGFSLINARIFC